MPEAVIKTVPFNRGRFSEEAQDISFHWVTPKQFAEHLWCYLTKWCKIAGYEATEEDLKDEISISRLVIIHHKPS